MVFSPLSLEPKQDNSQKHDCGPLNFFFGSFRVRRDSHVDGAGEKRSFPSIQDESSYRKWVGSDVSGEEEELETAESNEGRC